MARPCTPLSSSRFNQTAHGVFRLGSRLASPEGSYGLRSPADNPTGLTICPRASLRAPAISDVSGTAWGGHHCTPCSALDSESMKSLAKPFAFQQEAALPPQPESRGLRVGFPVTAAYQGLSAARARRPWRGACCRASPADQHTADERDGGGRSGPAGAAVTGSGNGWWGRVRAEA